MVEPIKLTTALALIYDGDCPLCQKLALVTKLRKEYGQLQLINARNSDHPLLVEISQRGFDLDQGMVVYHQKKFLYGAEAISFLANHEEGLTTLAKLRIVFAKQRFLMKMVYPWLVFLRKQLLAFKGIQPIDNLGLKQQAIFKSIFADQWHNLPPVFHKHYSNRPFSRDIHRAKGLVNIECHKALRYFSSISRFFGYMPLYQQDNVAISVHFVSHANNKAFTLHRQFFFSETPRPYHFRSAMYQEKNNLVVEKLPLGLSWHCRYIWQSNQVTLHHEGYSMTLLGLSFKIPLEWLIGQITDEETAIDEDTFSINMRIQHPLWGNLYRYYGKFTIID